MREKKTIDEKVLQSYVDHGMSIKGIAERECVSESTVKKWKREFGISGRSEPGRKKVQKPAEEQDEIPIIKKEVPVGHNADRHLCKRCIYRGRIENSNGCDFAQHHEHSRSYYCSVENCNVYERGKRLKPKQKNISLRA